MSREALLVVMVAACSGGGDKGPSFQGMHPRISYGAPKDQLVAGEKPVNFSAKFAFGSYLLWRPGRKEKGKRKKAKGEAPAA